MDELPDLTISPEKVAAIRHNRCTAQYLTGIPLLSNYLEEALTQFGHSAEEFEQPL